jgi:heat shock protein HspQ
MPDTSIEEQRALTSAAKDGTTGLSFDLSDPFAALTSLESFASFGEKDNTATDKPSYFTLFGEDEQDLDPFLSKSQLTLPSFGTLDF